MSEKPTSAGLPNVNAMSLAEVLEGENNALAKAARRLAAEVSKKTDPLAAFTSYVEK